MRYERHRFRYSAEVRTRVILSAAAYLTVWTTGRLHTASSFRPAHYLNKFKSVDLRTRFQFYCMFYSLLAPPGC